MLKEGVTIAKRRTWLLRLVGATLCVSTSFHLIEAFLTPHFELGASRRHLVFDLQHGRIHYSAGILLLVAMLVLSVLLTLLGVFESETARRRYRNVSIVAGGVAMAAIALAYAAQLWRS